MELRFLIIWLIFWKSCCSLFTDKFSKSHFLSPFHVNIENMLVTYDSVWLHCFKITLNTFNPRQTYQCLPVSVLSQAFHIDLSTDLWLCELFFLTISGSLCILFKLLVLLDSEGLEDLRKDFPICSFSSLNYSVTSFCWTTLASDLYQWESPVFPSSTLLQAVHESHAVSRDSVPTPLCPSLGLGNSDSKIPRDP